MHSCIGSRATTRGVFRITFSAKLSEQTLPPARGFTSSAESVENVIRKFRSPANDEEVTYRELSDVCENISAYPKKRDLAEAILYRFKLMCPALNVQDCLSFLQGLHKVVSLRSYQNVSSELRTTASYIAARGVSSFSLDQLAEYLEFCQRVRAHIDPVFLLNMCERIAAVEVTDSIEDQRELCSYILRVNKILDSSVLRFRLQTISVLALERLSLDDLQAILTQLSNDAEAHEFIATVRKAVIGALKSRNVADILEELSPPTLMSSHDIFKASLAVCESRLNPDTMSTMEAALLLRAWGRQRMVSAKFSDTQLLNSIISKALAEEGELVSNLQSLSRLTDVEFPQNTVVDAIIAKGDIAIEDLPSVVESITLLRLHSSELVGLIMSHIDSYLCEVRDSAPFWKFAVWWQSLCNSLPYNSLLVEVLSKEFPETVRLLTSCPSDEFIQQVRPRTWYAKTIQSISTHLKNNRVEFTTLPRMEHTPIRAHLRVKVGDVWCYVFLLKNEMNLQQVSSDSRISLKLIREIAHANKHCIAFVPSEELMEPTLENPLEAIRSRIDIVS